MARKPFRFGVIAEHMTVRRAWRELARRAEALGYSTLLLRDHHVSDFFGHQFAPLIALMAAADATTTLRLGTMVIDNDFRHPALLAKETATLDLFSEGRFELGIGAGWLEREYATAGIPYDPAGERIGRLEESITILRRLWSGEVVTHAGTHYQLDGYSSWPQPMQSGGPPLLVGGGGRRLLTMAGRYADIVSVLSTSVATGVMVDDPRMRLAGAVADKIGWIRDGAGDRFDEIELSLIPGITLTRERAAAIRAEIEHRAWAGISPADVDEMPSVLIGSEGEIAEQLFRWREQLGFSYIVVGDDMFETLSPIVRTLAGS